MGSNGLSILAWSRSLLGPNKAQDSPKLRTPLKAWPPQSSASILLIRIIPVSYYQNRPAFSVSKKKRAAFRFKKIELHLPQTTLLQQHQIAPLLATMPPHFCCHPIVPPKISPHQAKAITTSAPPRGARDAVVLDVTSRASSR